MIAAILDRLETVLAEESAALNRGGSIDMRHFIAQKNQLLLELTRSRGQRHMAEAPDLARRAERLKALTTENARALSVQIEAAREVTEIIVEAMREAESDGTYSPLWFSRAAR